MTQSVTLRKMNDDEYVLWREWSLADYAKELVASGQCIQSDAREKAESDFSQGLKNGLSTLNHHVMVAENADAVPVGMIWYQTENPKFAFIADFAVYQEHRRMGYGYAILTQLENTLRANAIPAMVLHVFEHNISAIKLYEKFGFVKRQVDGADAGSMYMQKQI